jgi:hypothetical protein
MAGHRNHSCTYFDDGELVCDCGRRAVYVIDDESLELVLVAFEDDAAPAPRVREELAISA